MPDNLIGQVIGNYQIISEIGRGGMAIVYKAFQTSLNRYVAIKVLPPYFQHTEEFLDRFKREALAAAQMQHPNIVQIYETGEWNGYHYIVMEYVDGESLHTIMQKRGALDINTAFNLVAQIGSALDYAHTTATDRHRGYSKRKIRFNDADCGWRGDWLDDAFVCCACRFVGAFVADVTCRRAKLAGICPDCCGYFANACTGCSGNERNEQPFAANSRCHRGNCDPSTGNFYLNAHAGANDHINRYPIANSCRP